MTVADYYYCRAVEKMIFQVSQVFWCNIEFHRLPKFQMFLFTSSRAVSANCKPQMAQEHQAQIKNKSPPADSDRSNRDFFHILLGSSCIRSCLSFQQWMLKPNFWIIKFYLLVACRSRPLKYLLAVKSLSREALEIKSKHK